MYEGYHDLLLQRKKIKQIYLRDIFKNCRAILDIGCGNGYRIEWIGKEKCTGIDVSKKAVRICRKKDIKAFVMPCTALKFKSNSFDGIMCYCVLEHLLPSDAFQTMREIHRILNPGGIVFIEVPCANVGNYFWGDYTHIRPYTHGSLKQLAYDAGFRDFHIYYKSIIGKLFKKNYLIQSILFRLAPFWSKRIVLEIKK